MFVLCLLTWPFQAQSRARSLADFNSRFFAQEEIEYSSFSYRIAAARALSSIIPISIGASLQALPSHTEAELILENLVLHLPKCMRSFVDETGSVNEILFQTHMMIHAYVSYLISLNWKLTCSQQQHIPAQTAIESSHPRTCSPDYLRSKRCGPALRVHSAPHTEDRGCS